MSKLQYIKFSITAAHDGSGKLSAAAVRRVEYSADTSSYPKYLDGIIMHALSHTRMNNDTANDRFTYVFPFKLT